MAVDQFEDFKGPLEEDRKGRGRIVGKISGRDAPAPWGKKSDRSGRTRNSKNNSKNNRAWKGTVADRSRVARGMPQAVLKITSYGSGLHKAKILARYIGQQGEAKVETDDGAILDTVEELDQLAEDWSADFSSRKGKVRSARDVMHLVVSVPVGSDREKTVDAAREFFADTFGANHAYAFAAHDETDHFHVHLLVKLRGRDGKSMRSSRKDPDLWRQQFATKAREKGINVDASPRAARGKGQKSSPPTAIYEMRKRGEVPRTDEARAQDALRRARALDDQPTEHEQRIRDINGVERLEFARKAYQVIEHSKKLTGDAQRIAALEMASDLAVWAERMPVPKSRTELLIEAVKPARVDGEPVPDDVRAFTKLTERGIRDQVKTFSKPALQRQAIAARAKLSTVLNTAGKAAKPDVDR